MRKKKRGAALVIVVLTMSILFILGTTMLSVANFSYKSRIRESNRIRNLYGADSGVNVVENIITLTCEKAIDYARKDIKSSIEDISKSELEINNEFKFIDLYNPQITNIDTIWANIMDMDEDKLKEAIELLEEKVLERNPTI